MAGAAPSVRDELLALDKDGNGRIDVDELAAAVEQLAHNRATIRNLKLVIAGLAFACLLIIGATFGLSFATARLSRNLDEGNNYALVDVSSGNTLRTASGQLPAPYTLLDVITTADNVTTVRYTLPKAVGEHGCRLYTEGRFSIPASLAGPDAVYGGSLRPRTYKILELHGCRPDGSLSSTVPLEATLKAADIAFDVFVFFSCPLTAGNCTAAQFFSANGTSLPMSSTVNRRMLTSGTHDFLASLVTPTTRRAVLQAAVPGALHPSAGMRAFTSLALIPAMEVEVAGASTTTDTGMVSVPAGTQAGAHQARHSSTSRRSLQGASEEQLQQQEEEQNGGAQLSFYALPAWVPGSGVESGPSRDLLAVYPGEHGKRRRMSEGALAVYQQHIYASPSVDQGLISYYDCVLCTYMWRRGLLADNVYAGDSQFGDLVKAHAPWLHAGYLTYGRKMVTFLSWFGEWHTTAVSGPLVVRWANAMSWIMGTSGAAFDLEGLLAFAVGLPGTALLGALQPLLTPALIEVLAWLMVAWVEIHTLSHWAATSLLGAGWLGLVMPQALLLLLVAARQLLPKHPYRSRAIKLAKQA